ncbi:MAG: hypothetical protein IJT30_07240, partial [Muribaculaceae bacterium]|nr:hypothetical protein [Muribaculaceae bacterium]
RICTRSASPKQAWRCTHLIADFAQLETKSTQQSIPIRLKQFIEPTLRFFSLPVQDFGTHPLLLCSVNEKAGHKKFFTILVRNAHRYKKNDYLCIS